MKAFLSTLVLVVFVPFLGVSHVHAQHPLDGHWEGAISILGSQLTIMVDFTTSNDSINATIDIPQQGAKGLTLKNVTFKHPSVHFELPAGPSLAIFRGSLTADSIRGDFFQAGITGEFYLKQGVRTTPPVAKEQSVPYREEDVRFTHGDITLAGTLTLPAGAGPHPAIIMITGSGPQNRDEEIFGFKPFRMIADHLTRKGIAVLRYDDRGVGGSSGNTGLSTTADFADDVNAALKFLMARSDINPRSIGLCGHSEGGNVAAIVGSRSNGIAFIVLMAGPAVSGEKLILGQMEGLARLSGVPEDEIRKSVQLERRIFESVHTGQGWNDVERELRAAVTESVGKMTAEQRKAISDVNKFVENTANSQLQAAQSRWFKFLIEYDPAPDLAKLTCPVLAVFGELDTQVPAALNRDPMQAALTAGGNKESVVRVLPKANHLFLTAVTGSPAEYATMTKEFVPGFLDFLSDWLLKRAKSLK